MNLLLDLYSNQTVLRRMDLGIGNSRAKQPSYQPDLDLNSLLMSVEQECMLDLMYSNSIVDNARTPRSCFKFLNSFIDSYFNIYTLNVIDKFQDHYIYVYSMQNLLAVVLNHMCNFDLNNMDKIPNLDDFSIDTLEMYFSKDYYLKFLLGVDENLDKYIYDLSKTDNSEFELLKNFTSAINFNMTNMLKYIGTYIESNTIMSLMSIDKSKILFRSMRNDIEDVIVNYNGIKFQLHPLIIKDTFDYVHNYKNFKYGEILCY